jgi:hypothetical protein
MSRAHWASVAGILALLAVSCGASGPFEHVGEASGRWVTAVTLPTTSAPEVIVEIGDEGLVGATDVLWANDGIGTPALGGDPTATIADVWSRRAGSRFVQAHRAEIATALPTIRFPQAVPEDVRWVTSQLVYDPASGLLDADTSAAFGLWAVEPYTSESGRIAVLRVGASPEGAAAERSAIVPFVVPDGLSLGWTESGLRYELFCRAPISETVCTTIAESFIPLSDLLPA